ncbi:hypothetical protein [Marinobacterium mangrovicola]|uniref:Uncharacterized protein n=1 Tax=Marinobacterium mangrovicola TaxID=1476959 RepID=A0A4R1GJ65_9GAMM|nr:hypothetical protein [Marinobacterium mangrovicola]TCK07251.1 hypothetical protein CLV83_2111 [Marinobacterium mangrovicola]
MVNDFFDEFKRLFRDARYSDITVVKISSEASEFFSGEVKDICKSQSSFDYGRIKRQINELARLDSNLQLCNPVSGELTRVCFSRTHGMSNFLIFADAEYSNIWMLGQTTSFIDIVIVNGKIYRTGFDSATCLKNFEAAVFEGVFDNYSGGFSSKAALVLKCARPFHSIYDQEYWLWFLCQNNESDIGFKIFDEVSFIDPALIVNEFDTVNSFAQKNDDYACFFPCFFPRNSYLKSIASDSGSGYQDSLEIKRLVSTVKDYEIFLRGCSDQEIVKKDDCFYLWIGITGQKRSWVEQSSGYAQIINYLSNSIDKKLVVFVDGWTAVHGSKAQGQVCDEDNAVASEIFLNLNCHDKVEFVSLVGFDYASKISASKVVDFFISNGGAGATVPLRIAQLPGVIHSNSSLFTFPDNYPSSIKIINKPPLVSDLVGEDNLISDKTSYSIAWDVVLNKLLDAIFELRGESFINRDLEECKARSIEFIESRLGKSIGYFPDIFRTIAVFFEMRKDMFWAYKAISLAHEARPSGDFLINKKKKYCKYLDFEIISYQDYKRRHSA